MDAARHVLLLKLLVLLGLLTLGVPAKAVTLYLVRHAEKQTGDDPGLTDTGHRRAADLALLLREAGIQHVYSSDFRRTRETAAPLAAALDLEVRIYDPTALAALAAELKRLDGNALVVGHSDTTPELVRFLGGEAAPLPEWQYDRLYQIRLGPAAAETILLHLAPASVAPDQKM